MSGKSCRFLARQYTTFVPNLNFKYIKDNAEIIRNNLKHRNVSNVNLDSILRLIDSTKELDFEIQQLKKQRNLLGKPRSKEARELDEWRQQQLEFKQKIAEGEKKLEETKGQLLEEAFHLPNDTDPSVPIGTEESDAEILEIVNEPRKEEGLKDHVQIATELDLVDFDRAGKVSGTGFYYLKNMGALLEMALTRYAFDFCIKRGFTPVIAPDLIRHEVLSACGFSPRSNDPQTYYIEQSNTKNSDKRDPYQHCLTATAEFPLAAMHANETFLASKLPIKMVAFSHCFRAEGLAGALNRGLYRVHQFSKVEMFGITTPEKSSELLEEFREIEQDIFSSLGDLGAPAYKKYDIEAWMPGKKTWGEISSTSNCTDYQARRLNIRYFLPNPGVGAQKTGFAHTVNGTAMAVPRMIISILETFQDGDDVIVPQVLRPYLYGIERLTPSTDLRKHQN